jgi:hypothetical protein
MATRPSTHHGARSTNKTNSPARPEGEPKRFNTPNNSDGRLRILSAARTRKISDPPAPQLVSPTNEEFVPTHEELFSGKPFRRGNLLLVPYGISEELRFALVPANRVNRSFYSSDLTQEDKDVLFQVAQVLNQVVFVVSMNYAYDLNRDIVQSLQIVQEEAWREELEADRKQEEKDLIKQAKEAKKKKEREMRSKRKPGTVDEDKILKNIITNHHATEMDYPLRWDHVCSIDKSTLGYRYANPNNGQADPSLSNRLSELFSLQSDTIRKEKQEKSMKK